MQTLGTDRQSEIVTEEMRREIPLPQLRVMLWPFIEKQNGNILIKQVNALK